jgi:hypothetical protein
MPSKTEGFHNAEFLLESEESLSLDKVTLIAGQNLVGGTILGKITASGKYTQHNTAAADGSQNAAAILFNDTNATLVDTPATVVTRIAEVADSRLVYMTGITAPNKTAAISALAALNIIVRT